MNNPSNLKPGQRCFICKKPAVEPGWSGLQGMCAEHRAEAQAQRDWDNPTLRLPGEALVTCYLCGAKVPARHAYGPWCRACNLRKSEELHKNEARLREFNRTRPYPILVTL